MSQSDKSVLQKSLESSLKKVWGDWHQELLWWSQKDSIRLQWNYKNRPWQWGWKLGIVIKRT